LYLCNSLSMQPLIFLLIGNSSTFRITVSTA
jgi:hypothetical protein